MKRLLASVLFLGAAIPFLTHCDSMAGKVKNPESLKAAATGCKALESGDFASLAVQGSAQTQAQIKAFLSATYNLNQVGFEMEQSLIASCKELGLAIGADASKLDAKAGDGSGAEGVCGAVSAKIDAIVKANASAKLQVQAKPPGCYVPVDAMLDCYQGCGAAIDAGKLEASCEGGEIAGSCEAECKGSCVVEAGAKCEGSCSATCEGSCDAQFYGTCSGTCEGTCHGTMNGGKCDGQCEGSCKAGAEGSCGGSCSGSCSGSCEIKAAAQCEGTCHGGCSVEYKEPKCTGSFEPPSVDASCQLECSGKAAAELHCEPASVHVSVKGKAEAEMKTLATALQASLPKILEIQMGTAKRLKGLGQAAVKAGGELSGAATSAGAEAAACVAASAKMAAAAAASVDVSVKASVQVSASASASVG